MSPHAFFSLHTSLCPIFSSQKSSYNRWEGEKLTYKKINKPSLHKVVPKLWQKYPIPKQQSPEQQPTAELELLIPALAAYPTVTPLRQQPSWLQNLEGPNSSTSPKDVCPAQAIPDLANNGEEEGVWNSSFPSLLSHTTSPAPNPCKPLAFLVFIQTASQI